MVTCETVAGLESADEIPDWLWHGSVVMREHPASLITWLWARELEA